MNVLVIGSGGREHALCWKLRQSKQITKLFAAPGNPGMAALGTLLNVAVDDVAGMVAAAKEHKIDLTVVGPDLAVSLGVVDAFRAAGLKIFGPTQAAGRIESSKSFAKEIMKGGGVATAAFEVFYSAAEAKKYLETSPIPIVLKADGLAAGKGVVVCHSRDEAFGALDYIFAGLSSAKVVIEEFMAGVEASFIIATDGETIVPLPISHDYKRLGDADKGPNTGGMGSVSPTDHLPPALAPKVLAEVIAPTLAELARRGTPFSGFLYAGLMVTPQGEAKVVEFNARLGDPETQVLMRRIDADLLPVIDRLSTLIKNPPQRAEDIKIDSSLMISPRYAVGIVLATAGYPEKPEKGDVIEGIEFAQSLPEVVVFQAGTSVQGGGKLVTAGGRVLNVTACADTLEEARRRAYQACDMIQFRGRHARRDIGLPLV